MKCFLIRYLKGEQMKKSELVNFYLTVMLLTLLVSLLLTNPEFTVRMFMDFMK